MQVPTNPFYDRASRTLNGLSQKADRLQTSIATGTRLTAPSDDSAAYQRMALIKRENSAGSVDKANLSLADGVIEQGGTTLKAITDQLQRASELTLQARNGTQDATSRGAIADELAEIVANLVSLANTKDSRGQPLFGAADGAPAVVKNDDGSYAIAETSVSVIPVGDGITVQANENAARVLGGSADNILAALDRYVVALRAGTDVDAESGVAIDRLEAAQDQVSGVTASLGARGARVELEQSRLTAANVQRETERSSLEDTDMTTAIVDLQKTMTILSATQASFSKLSQLTLFNYLK